MGLLLAILRVSGILLVKRHAIAYELYSCHLQIGMSDLLGGLKVVFRGLCFIENSKLFNACLTWPGKQRFLSGI